MIIDAHLHLDDTEGRTVMEAAIELDRQLKQAGIIRAIVLHLEKQPWSFKEFSLAIASFPRLRGFINIHPANPKAIANLHEGIKELGFIGLKLHPRLQEFEVDHALTIELVKEAGKLGIPVLFDAFPDGTHLMQGFSPLKYAKLAKECHQTKIIWAHMGGHYVLDFLMLAKRLPNVYMDISYSLLYYQTSSVVDDIVYALRSLKFERVFYGSDYPDRPIEISLNSSLEILKQKGLSKLELEKLTATNAIDFFKWEDLKL